jgi:hypothetical protein
MKIWELGRRLRWGRLGYRLAGGRVGGGRGGSELTFLPPSRSTLNATHPCSRRHPSYGSHASLNLSRSSDCAFQTARLLVVLRQV